MKKGAGAGAGAGAGGKKKGAAGPGVGGVDVGGEKVDGRAGPRSEAVVLGKSVEHIRELLRTREELLLRLSGAYAEARERGVKVPPGQRAWDEKWIEVGVKEEGEAEGDWSEEEQ